MLCFAIINSVLDNLLCVWILRSSVLFCLLACLFVCRIYAHHFRIISSLFLLLLFSFVSFSICCRSSQIHTQPMVLPTDLVTKPRNRSECATIQSHKLIQKTNDGPHFFLLLFFPFEF